MIIHSKKCNTSVREHTLLCRREGGGGGGFDKLFKKKFHSPGDHRPKYFMA